MPPNMVRNFIKKAKLKAAYKFAVLTYGARKCDSVEIWNDISSKAGNKFDYINTLIMVDNWLPNFDMNEQIKIDKHIPENLRQITEDLSQRRHWHEPVSEEERQMHAGFMARSGARPGSRFFSKGAKIILLSRRIALIVELCTDVCPRGNYEFTSNGIKMQGDCDFCFACIQNCPQKAIQFKKNDEDPLLANGERNPNARYRNEYISLVDIKRANRQ